MDAGIRNSRIQKIGIWNLEGWNPESSNSVDSVHGDATNFFCLSGNSMVHTTVKNQLYSTQTLTLFKSELV